MDDVTTKFHNTSSTLEDEIKRAKKLLRELRREQKLANLAAAKARRRAAGIPEPSHHKRKRKEGGEGEEEGEGEKPPAAAFEGAYVFGAQAIAKLTGMKVSTVYYWVSTGKFGDAVWSAGPRTLVGDREKLKKLGPQ